MVSSRGYCSRVDGNIRFWTITYFYFDTYHINLTSLRISTGQDPLSLAASLSVGRTGSRRTSLGSGAVRKSVGISYLIKPAIGRLISKMIRPTFIGLVLTTLLGGANSFVVPAPGRVATTPSTSQLYVDTSTGYDSFERLKKLTNVPSGEGQRKFRRTVYSHDDWKKHRQQDRFVVYLAAIFKSGVYKNLAGEVTLTTLIATFVCVYNLVVGGYTDFAGIQHDAIIQSTLFPKLGLPLAAFTLTSPSLGLLLGKCMCKFIYL